MLYYAVEFKGTSKKAEFVPAAWRSSTFWSSAVEIKRHNKATFTQTLRLNPRTRALLRFREITHQGVSGSSGFVRTDDPRLNLTLLPVAID